MSVTISGVMSVTDTKCHDVNIYSLLGGIQDGRWKEPVCEIRAAAALGGKKAANALKQKLPAATFSGRFNERNDAGIDSHSGLICLDIDNLNGDVEAVREKLRRDKHVAHLFLSPTGTGLKVLVAVEPDASKHSERFKDAQFYFKDTYGIEIDPSGINPSRLCFVSYDPLMFSRPNAEIIPPRPPNIYYQLTKRYGVP